MCQMHLLTTFWNLKQINHTQFQESIWSIMQRQKNIFESLGHKLAKAPKAKDTLPNLTSKLDLCTMHHFAMISWVWPFNRGGYNFRTSAFGISIRSPCGGLKTVAKNTGDPLVRREKSCPSWESPRSTICLEDQSYPSSRWSSEALYKCVQMENSWWCSLSHL